MPEAQLTTSAGFAELLSATTRTADHLELRDGYAPGDDPMFQTWCDTGRVPTDPEDAYWRGWTSTVRTATARGVSVRRLRVVSEPMSEYLRFEHASAAALVAAGEDLRWLPRGRTAGLLLPALDLWLFDQTVLRYHLFDGDGHSIADVNDGNPDTAARYAEAWAAAWERATPHADYRPG